MADYVEKNISFKIDQETYDKLFYIAESENRSGKGQIIHLIRNCIKEFEQQHGNIQLEDIQKYKDRLQEKRKK